MARAEVHRAAVCPDFHSAASSSHARPSAPAAIFLPASLRHQAVPSVRCQAVPASTVTALVREAEKSQLRQLPRDVENVADDPNLHNPLQRQQRLSTGWMGVSALRQQQQSRQANHRLHNQTKFQPWALVSV